MPEAAPVMMAVLGIVASQARCAFTSIPRLDPGDNVLRQKNRHPSPRGAASVRALIGPDGEELTRLPGHIAYWFAWSNYLGGVGTLAEKPKK